MRPVSEQTILITGSTDGLGKATAVALAKRGATVLLHGRSRERLEATSAEISRETGRRDNRSFLADLSSLAEVRSLARQITENCDRLDVLVNNAGIGAGNTQEGKAHREESADGFELRFAVNYLAPFLLTRLLLPLIRASAPSRIVNVSSVGQAPLDFDDVMLKRRYEPFDAYRQSKLAQIMDTMELAHELDGSGVAVNSLHPASLMNTKMVFEWFGHTMSTVEDGVDSLLYVATSPELDGISGAFFDRTNRSRANSQAYDPAARSRLVELSKEMVGLK